MSVQRLPETWALTSSKGGIAKPRIEVGTGPCCIVSIAHISASVDACETPLLVRLKADEEVLMSWWVSPVAPLVSPFPTHLDIGPDVAVELDMDAAGTGNTGIINMIGHTEQTEATG